MKLVYSVAELAARLGQTKFETLNLLRSQHVPMRKVGTKFKVTIAAIDNAWPELAQSIRGEK